MDANTEVYGTVKESTDLAWLFDNGDVEAWVPKSCSTWEPDFRVLGPGLMTLPERMAFEKRLA